MVDRLKQILKQKPVIVGIGNVMKGDDAFGPALIARLSGKIGATLIDAGSAPENYIGTIAKGKSDTVLLLDCAHLDLLPGQYAILEESEIVRSGFTTHDISPALFMEHLKMRTKAKIYMLGVEPRNISFGESMSKEATKALQEIEKLILEAYNA